MKTFRISKNIIALATSLLFPLSLQAGDLRIDGDLNVNQKLSASNVVTGLSNIVIKSSLYLDRLDNVQTNVYLPPKQIFFKTPADDYSNTIGSDPGTGVSLNFGTRGNGAFIFMWGDGQGVNGENTYVGFAQDYVNNDIAFSMEGGANSQGKLRFGNVGKIYSKSGYPLILQSDNSQGGAGNGLNANDGVVISRTPRTSLTPPDGTNNTNASIAVFQYDTVERGRFTIGGNFGIATKTPSAKLHVNGDAKFEGPVHIVPQGDLSMGVFTHSPSQ